MGETEDINHIVEKGEVEDGGENLEIENLGVNLREAPGNKEFGFL